jgi:hypothetical protein
LFLFSSSSNMDPLRKIKGCSLSLCGIFARMSGHKLSHAAAMEECLNQTQEIGNNAILMDAKLRDYRKKCGQLEQDKYKLREVQLKLESKILALEQENEMKGAKLNESQGLLDLLDASDEEMSQPNEEMSQPTSSQSQSTLSQSQLPSAPPENSQPSSPSLPSLRDSQTTD